MRRAVDLFSSLPSCLTTAVGSALTSRGFAIVDNALPPGGAAAVRGELAALHAASLLILNSTHLVAGGTRTLLPKHGVWEAEPRAGGAAAAVAPSLAAAAHDVTLATMVSVAAPSLDVAGPSFLKAQLNLGSGGCFPIHFDSDEAVDGRRVTANIYAGGGDDEAESGENASSPPPGALRLWPTLDPHASIDIVPHAGRLVLFAATRLPHRVLPTRAAGRTCFSVWLSAGRPRRPPPPLAAIVADLTAARASPATARHRLLAEPDGRRALAAVRLAALWDESLVEAHPPGPALDAARAARAADVAAVEGACARVGVDPHEAGLGEAAGDPRGAWF